MMVIDKCSYKKSNMQWNNQYLPKYSFLDIPKHSIREMEVLRNFCLYVYFTTYPVVNSSGLIW